MTRGYTRAERQTSGSSSLLVALVILNVKTQIKTDPFSNSLHNMAAAAGGEESMVVHEGGCHCKRVRWRAQAGSSVEAWKCNCSDCGMRGNVHFTVPAERFELVGDSDKYLTTYEFATHTAKHIFCKVCGITSFYVPRSSPHGVALTYKCVDPGTLNHVQIQHVDGRSFGT